MTEITKKNTLGSFFGPIWVSLKWSGFLAIFLILMWLFVYPPELKDIIKNYEIVFESICQSRTFEIGSRIIITTALIIFGVSIIRQHKRDQLD